MYKSNLTAVNDQNIQTKTYPSIKPAYYALLCRST